MTAQARFRQADLAKVLKTALKCGCEDVRIHIAVDGGIDLIVGKAVNDQSPVDLD